MSEEKQDDNIEKIEVVKDKAEKDIYYIIGHSQMKKYDHLMTLVLFLIMLLIGIIIIGLFFAAYLVTWFNTSDWFYRILLALESCA